MKKFKSKVKSGVAKLFTGSGSSSTVKPRNEEKSKPFEHIKNIGDLKKLLEEINKATGRARKHERDPVSPVVMDAVNGAETVLSGVTNFGQSIDITQSSGSNELYKILCDVLKGAGKLHWAAAGLSMVAYVLDRVGLVQQNYDDCLDLLEDMGTLGSHVVTLYTRLSEEDESLQRAICFLSEGAISCCGYLDHHFLVRFGFANVDKDNLLSLRTKIACRYPELNLRVAEITYDNTETIKTQTAEINLKIPEPLSSSKPRDPSNKVGLDERVDDLLGILGMKDTQGLGTGVQAVVLHGMGGIGKSTLGDALGNALYERLPIRDRAYARVEIGEQPTDERIRDRQAEILERLSGQKMAIGDWSEGCQELTSFFQKCTAPKLLLVDNIFIGEDLDKLLPEKLILPTGSRVVVTSRDKSVCAVLEEKGVDCHTYPVAALGETDARELLCMHVGRPLPTGKEALVTDLLNICGGLPLALEVVGRYLRRHNDDRAWAFVIESLTKCLPVDGRENEKLYQTLIFSYNQLQSDYQKLFLDITCFFKDWWWEVLEPIYGDKLVALEELALVRKTTASGSCELQVHDLLVALGQSKQQPGTRIQSLHILPDFLQNNDMDACCIVELLSVRFCKAHIRAEALDAMHKSLRVLSLRYVKVLGRCSNTANGLQLLHIRNAGMPYEDLSKMSQLRKVLLLDPTDFEFGNVKFPKHLKVLTLENIESLKCLPGDFGELASLDTLEIHDCNKIQELPETFGQLQSLHTLSLKRCKELKKLPRDFQGLRSLQSLNLGSCEQLQELPSGFGKLGALQQLQLSGCEILTKLPDDFSELESLKYLNLANCYSLEALPKDFGNLVSLEGLVLARCSSLEQLPEGFENLCSLQALHLNCCQKLSMLPTNFGRLRSLSYLDLEQCKGVKELPESFFQMSGLRTLNVTGCPFLNQNLVEELKQQNVELTVIERWR